MDGRFPFKLSLNGGGSSDCPQSRLCGNIFGNWRQDAAATTAAKRVQVGDLKRGCEGASPPKLSSPPSVSRNQGS